MKKIFRKKGFTLIEIMIVITIMVLILMFSYAPYNLYQNKAKVKLATREVSQSLYEARNMAISGVQEKNGEDNNFSNKSVGILLDTKENENTKIKYFYFDKDIIKENGKIDSLDLKNPSKEKNIQNGVIISKFPDSGAEKILIIYKSVTGEINIFNGENFQKIPGDTLKIKLTYAKSSSSLLQREMTYYLKTNIVDYK